MASAIVQHKTDENSNAGGAITIVLDTTPVEGNLLLAVMLERNSAPESPFDSMTTAGYTHIRRERLDDADGNERRGYTVYYKFAGASESTTVTGTFENALANSILHVAEFSGIESFRASVAANASTTDDILVWTGPNITTSANATIIPMTFWKGENISPSNTNIGIAYNNGISEGSKWGYVGDSFLFAIGCGYGDKASAGTYGTTVTLTSDNTDSRNVTMMMMEFETTGGGPAAATDNPAFIGASI